MKRTLFVVLLWVGVVTILHADPVIGFDDVPSTQFTQVPSGYHLLNWSGFSWLNGTTFFSNPSGFQPGAVSPFNVIYPGNSTNASILGGMFDFVSAYATAAYNDNLQLEAKGYIKGTLVYDQTNTLSATAATLIQYNFYGVEEVDFVSSGGSQHAGYPASGTYFALDNVSVVTYLPYSALLKNGGFETSDFSGWSRGGNTNNSSVVSGDATYVHTGTYGAKMGPSLTPGYLGQTITPTEIGQLYTVSFWLRNPNAVTNFFGVTWNGTSILALTNLPAFAFTNYQFDLTAWRPSEFLQFQFQFQNDPAWFGFDDVSVTPKVLLNNGGFETGDFSGWTHTGNTNGDAVVSNRRRAGSFSLDTGPLHTPSFLSQSIITQPGQPYLISAWLETIAGGPPNDFQIYWDSQSSLEVTNLLSAVGWTNIHVTALSGNSQSTLQFGFINTSGFFFFDEASVHPVPILQNGGFEFGDFTGWTRSGNLGATVVTTNTLYLNGGYYGAEFGPVGSLGFISQSFATVPGQSYLIGFTFGLQYPMTNAEFSVTWNGAVLMDITNLFVLGQVPFEFPVVATGTNTTLQFGFRNDPKFFSLDDVFVSPIPAPVLQSITRSNNLVDLSWSALPGYQYDLQYTTNLAVPNWTDLQGFRFPTNFPMQGTDTNPPDARRFYRVKLAPPPLIF